MTVPAAGHPRRFLGELSATGGDRGLRRGAADIVADHARGGRAGSHTIPGDLSILALGAQTRPVRVDVDLTGFRIPRQEMGRRCRRAAGGGAGGRRGDAAGVYWPAELVEGSTLAPARS
ncbi:hypothetical protein [Streptosporangium vulgare]|uniref:hypothetical protein n=1 Tax=Streptosporangium vulgare TaxID=46190 RepID=UPI0031D47537